MMMERRSPHWGWFSLSVVVLTVMFPLASGLVLAGEANGKAETARHKVVSLNHISSEQGRKYLSQLGLGTVSKLPGANALLVTAPPGDLAKAVTILNLVDADYPFAIKTIAPASNARTLPSNEQIQDAMGGIIIGTFSNPPQAAGAARAIIDIHGGTVLAVAPVTRLQDILQAVELGPQVLKERKLAADKAKQETAAKSTEPTEPNLPRPVEPNVPKPIEGEQLREPVPTQTTRAADVNEPLTADELLAALQAIKADQNEPNTKVQAQTKPGPEAKSQGEAESQSLEQPEKSFVTSGPASKTPAEPNIAGNEKSSEAAKPDLAGRPYEPEPVVNAEETLKLNLPEKLAIVDLLELVGVYLHLDYMYDPVKVQGDVSLKLQGKLRGPMKVKDLYPLLESVLKFKGFVMTRKGNLVTIVPVMEAMEIDPVLVDPDTGKVKTGDVIVTHIFELQHVDASMAINLLDSMKLSVAVVPVGDTGALIVTGYAYRMERIERLLKVIDKPGPPRKFRFRQLRYTMAKTMAEKVKALAEELGSVPVTMSTGGTSTLRGTPVRPPTSRTPMTPTPPIRTPLPTMPTTPTAATKPSVYLDADERTNRIFMVGLEEQLVVVDELIDALDVQQQDLRTLKLYKIEYIEAAEARKKLEELGIVSAGATTYTSQRITGTPGGTPVGATPIQTPMRQTPIRGATGESAEEALAGQPQVVVIETTNSLLVNATAEQHTQIDMIIRYVDSEMLTDEIPYKLYPLENQPPDQIVKVLEKLIQDVVKDKEGKVEKIIKKEEGITIVPDPCTFSLIVYASKKNQDWIASLIKQLDKRRPQVLIDVTLVEISKTEDFNYDLNLISSIPDLTVTSGLTGAIATGKTSTDIINSLASSKRDRFIDLQSNKGAGTGFYGDEHIQFLLTAMQQKNYGRILAKPKILVNDNAKGSIQTTDTTYIAKRSSVPVSAGTAGQQNTLIETSLDYQGYPAGITLNITPHISEGDLLRLEIELTRSDFTTVTGEKPPDITESKINTVVTVPNSSTIILGGMIKLNQSKGGTKVPLLGDLPIIGAAFRTVSNSDLQRKLYVFVKAEVIRPADIITAGKRDIDKISERNRLAFEQHESEFQDYQDMPGIKPKSTYPATVLDAQ